VCPQDFVYPMMTGVAIDRAQRLADERSFPADRSRWPTVRGEVLRADHARGLRRQRQSLVQE
jgi:hypothetical protein